MKKIQNLTIVLISLLVMSIEVKAQVFEAEDIVLELDMGYPNLIPFFSNIQNYGHSGSFLTDDDQLNSFGQLIVKGEFFLTDRLGVTARGNYSYFKHYEIREYDIYDGETETWTAGQYEYEISTHIFRWGAGFNYHLARTDRLDSYIGISAGGFVQKKRLESDDPDANISDGYVAPAHFRVHYGLRYMFTPNLGFNAEFGLGGPLVSAGITYKI